MSNIFDQIFGGTTPRPSPDCKKDPNFDIAFDMWASKQKLHERLPEDKESKITISANQLLLLMKQSYIAGYRRAK